MMTNRMPRSLTGLALVGMALSLAGCAPNTAEPNVLPSSSPVSAAETCDAFSAAATEEANATSHFRRGTIAVDVYAERLAVAKRLFEAIPVEPGSELNNLIEDLDAYLAEPASDGLPFDRSVDAYDQLFSRIGFACGQAGSPVNIYMEPGTGG